MRRSYQVACADEALIRDLRAKKEELARAYAELQSRHDDLLRKGDARPQSMGHAVPAAHAPPNSFLIAATILLFAVAYVIFQRQEIRA